MILDFQPWWRSFGHFDSLIQADKGRLILRLIELLYNFWYEPHFVKLYSIGEIFYSDFSFTKRTCSSPKDFSFHHLIQIFTKRFCVSPNDRFRLVNIHQVISPRYLHLENPKIPGIQPTHSQILQNFKF